jgi:hypothetical protein
MLKCDKKYRLLNLASSNEKAALGIVNCNYQIRYCINKTRKGTNLWKNTDIADPTCLLLKQSKWKKD